MIPVKTERSNFTYFGPTPEIMDLPCELAEEAMGDGVAVVTCYSVWELSEVERSHIAQGGNIKLGIVGAAPIPPVSLQVVDERSKA